MAIGRRLHHVERQFCELRNHKFNLRNGHFQLEKFSQVMFQLVKSTCVLPDICDRLFQIFSSDICCLNSHFLLVIHQSQDSLVNKQEQRVNNLIYIWFVIFITQRSLGSLFSEKTFCIVLKEVKYRALLCLTYSF